MLTDDNALFELDRCVMCGLCLPHCPTYRLNLSESESPRGRINAMRVLFENDSCLNSTQFNHLDNCLNCLSCEAMCPSQVSYSALIDHARQRLNETHRLQRSIANRAITYLSTSDKGASWLLTGSYALRKRWVQQTLSFTGLTSFLKLRPIQQALTSSANTFAQVPRHTSPAHNKQVSLLTGCADRIWSGNTLADAIALLNASGYNIETPKSQTCCGALHQHEGEIPKAEACHSVNQQAFGNDCVLSVSTSCSAHLKKHAGLNSADIMDFLLADDDFMQLRFNPLEEEITVHIPCSQKNDLASGSSSERILSRIPGIKLRTLDDHFGCCGAAGTHFLRNPVAANTLRQPILKQTLKHASKLVASANIGCRLHLAAGFRELESITEVIHPISLLARQLRSPNAHDGDQS